MSALIVAAALGLLLLVALVVLMVRLRAEGGVPEPDPDWLDQFSLARYRPMERLLAEEEFRFVASQPGYRPEIGRRLRRERRRILRGYLRRLRRDFLRLHAAARALVAHSGEDRPELVSLLLKQRLLFSFAMTAVELRLLLHALGVGAFDARRLVEAVEGMGRDLRELAHAAGAAS